MWQPGDGILIDYDERFPIEEIERANAALERGSAIAWRRTCFDKYWDNMVKHEQDDNRFPQHQADYTFEFFNKIKGGKKGDLYARFQLELKHQQQLTKNVIITSIAASRLINCYVSDEWVKNCENGTYPRMAYAICLPRSNELYYCNKMKSLIKKAVKSKSLVKKGSKWLIQVDYNDFRSCERKVAKKDLETWEFVNEHQIKIYGKQQNYFPQKPAKLSLAPSKIDKLIMAKKIAIGELEKELAELLEYKRLDEKYREDLDG